MNSNSSDALVGAMGGLIVIFYILALLISFALGIVLLISVWKIFVKAGKPGWASLIPFYNIWVLCEITCNNNVLWFILSLLGVTAPVAMIVVILGLAKSFGKGVGFAILTILFYWIGLPILGFGSAQYTGDKI